MQLLVQHKLKDHDRWRRIFDDNLPATREAGFTLERVWRSVDDPNVVFFLFEIEDRKRAEAFMAEPGAAELGMEAGVVEGEVWFLEGA